MYRVLAFTVKPRTSADTRYRILQYIPFAERDGVQIEHRSLMSERFFQWQMENSHLAARLLTLPWLLIARFWQVLVQAPRYDAVWISREMAPLGPPVLEWLLVSRCCRVVMDVDDALHLVDKEGSRWLPRLLRDYGKYGRMAGRYAMVVCGNDFLADFYRSHGATVAIVPTVVNSDDYAAVEPSESSRVRIGWIGTPLNRHHVEMVGGALTALAAERDFEVVLVGITEPLNWQVPQVRYLRWNLASEMKFFTAFDIGIMPLKDSPFAQGKCAFKLIQYMAAGIPAIASSVGMNVSVLQDEAGGYIADTEEEWIACLRHLIDDAPLRREMGEAGRRTVRERYSVQSAWPIYRGILRGAVVPGNELMNQQTADIPSEESRSPKRRLWLASLCMLLALPLSCAAPLLHPVYSQPGEEAFAIHPNPLPFTAYIRPGAPHAMKIGVDVDHWSGQASDPRFEASLLAMKVDFLSWHLQPAQETEANLAPMILLCRKHGWGYLFNNEWGNYHRSEPALVHADGTYRYDFADSTLQLLKDDPLFLGVVYDENELMQEMNGSPDGAGGIIPPYFAQTATMTAPAAFDAVSAKVSQLQQRYASYGKRLIFEMVFPDNAHAYARGGAILAPKLLKESYDDLMYAVFRGAATEYHSQELWACADLWFLNNFPTNGMGGPGFHTPQQLFDALTFANAAGFDYVYVEQYKGLMDVSFNLTAYGQAVVAFQQSKAPALRGDWRTAPVQGYVRRFPDGYWGQQYSTFIPDHPYGSSLLNPYHGADKRWFALLKSASKDALPADADTWNAVKSPFFSKRPYTPMAGLPMFLVFDQYGVLPAAPGVPSVDLCSNAACSP